MSRRPVSPIRTIQPRSETDPRDNIIRKLKDDLIVARGKEKQLALLENYYVELIEKIKLLSAETAKSDEEGRLKLQLSLKSINDLKKELEVLKIQHRNITNQLRSVQQEEDEIKKHLHGRVIEIQKLKKQGMCLHEDNQKLLAQHYRLKSQEDQLLHDIKKLQQAIHSFQARLTQITRKILQVKSYIDGLKDDNTNLKDRLKQYENDNSGIGKNLDQKQDKIDGLQRTFAQKHQTIKELVQKYIEIEHSHDKNIKQIMHKNNLVKIQSQKQIQMTNNIKRLQKIVNDRKKQLSNIVTGSEEINRANDEFIRDNQKIKKDIAYCNEHLQNLLKHNAIIQQQMQNVLREDQAIISVIRRKKLMPPNNNYNSIRSSRAQMKRTPKTYQ